MKKLRTAVVGLGSMGKNHIRVLSELDESELIAVSDIDKKKLENICNKYNVKGYSDYKEMLKNEKPDMVSIVVPTKLHKQVGMDVMNAGINCLIEKPIADTVKNAEEIIKCAEKNNVKLTIGHIERFNPAVIELKKRIKELGKIWEIHIMRRGPFHGRTRDVGVATDLAVHDLDIMRYLLNSEPKEIKSISKRGIKTDKEDLVDAIIEFDNGTIDIINVNWLTPEKIRELIIIGENGMFKLNYITQDLEFFQHKEMNGVNSFTDFVEKSEQVTKIKIDVKKDEPLKLELKSFLKCIIENKEPFVIGKDGLEALRISEMMK